MMRPRSVKVPPRRNINSSRLSPCSCFLLPREPPIHAEIQEVNSEITRMRIGWSKGLNIRAPPLGIALSLQQVSNESIHGCQRDSDQADQLDLELLETAESNLPERQFCVSSVLPHAEAVSFCIWPCSPRRR